MGFAVLAKQNPPAGPGELSTSYRRSLLRLVRPRYSPSLPALVTSVSPVTVLFATYASYGAVTVAVQVMVPAVFATIWNAKPWVVPAARSVKVKSKGGWHQPPGL